MAAVTICSDFGAPPNNPTGFGHQLILQQGISWRMEEFWIIDVSTKDVCYFLQCRFA